MGAGIVGASVARALAEGGARVTVLDAAGVGGGATAAGMGHLLTLDGNAAELSLSTRSLELWREASARMPREAQFTELGTLWVAESPEEYALADARRPALHAAGVRAELLDAEALREAEAELAPDLAGALLLPDEGLVYSPVAAAALLEHPAITVREGARVARLLPPDGGRSASSAGSVGAVELESGEGLEAQAVVLATGWWTAALLPDELPGVRLFPKRGHLVISPRGALGLRHQVLELGYLAGTQKEEAGQVAFNLQPRPTGQLMLGSSRESGVSHREPNHALVGQMIRRGIRFLPGLAQLEALRIWTGVRPATSDHAPLIGALPGYPGTWLATGHEGLGITASLASGELLADLILQREPHIDPTPFDPARPPAHEEQHVESLS